ASNGRRFYQFNAQRWRAGRGKRIAREAKQVRELWYRFRSCPPKKAHSLWRGKLLLSLALQSAWDERWRCVWHRKARTLSSTTVLPRWMRSRQLRRSKNWAGEAARLRPI